MSKCRICGNIKYNKSHFALEMMFGTREEFEYIECNNCGCLQIKTIPDNIEKYYPDEYNAFDSQIFPGKKNIVFMLQKKKLQHLFGEKKNFIGWLITTLVKGSFEEKLVPAKINLNSKILDVGSGTGARLIRLRQKGFENITGIDVFIKKDIIYDKGLRILKKDINNLRERYDFIMMNHSFEHMPDPIGTLTAINRILLPNRFLLIRIPVAGSFSWEKYRTNWVALDAPRHFYLHTQKSMEILAQKTGFKITQALFDSSEYQFIGSEQFKNNIFLRSENSYFNNPEKSIFSKKTIRKYKKMAAKLNKVEKGDAACFYLYKSL